MANFNFPGSLEQCALTCMGLFFTHGKVLVGGGNNWKKL